jgi:hypothetical protein
MNTIGFVNNLEYQVKFICHKTDVNIMTFIYVLAAWFNETILIIIGCRADMQLYSINIMIFTINMTLITLNWADVDKVTFTTFLRAYNNLTYYSMDNMCLG